MPKKEDIGQLCFHVRGLENLSFSEKPKNNPQLDLVEGLLRAIQKKYRFDKKRIYLGGLSMGAMGTFELVYRNPRKFAAAFAICGGANPKIARKTSFLSPCVAHRPR